MPRQNATNVPWLNRDEYLSFRLGTVWRPSISVRSGELALIFATLSPKRCVEAGTEGPGRFERLN